MSQDLLPLKYLLEKYRISSLDHINNQDSNLNISPAVEADILKSDFFIGVITKIVDPNIFFEIGIARGAKKPIFLIIDGYELAPSLENITYVFASTNEVDKIEFSLDQFLSNYSIKNKNLKRFISWYNVNDSDKDKNLKSICNIWSLSEKDLKKCDYKIEKEIDIYDELRCWLKSSNVITKENQMRDQGADMSIWVDGLETIIGNPILVEIKYGNLSHNKLINSEDQLRNYVKKINGTIGLLIYFDKTGKKFDSKEVNWPLVIWLDFHDLISSLKKETLAEIILEKRNKMVHNKL